MMCIKLRVWTENQYVDEWNLEEDGVDAGVHHQQSVQQLPVN